MCSVPVRVSHKFLNRTNYTQACTDFVCGCFQNDNHLQFANWKNLTNKFTFQVCQPMSWYRKNVPLWIATTGGSTYRLSGIFSSSYTNMEDYVVSYWKYFSFSVFRSFARLLFVCIKRDVHNIFPPFIVTYLLQLLVYSDTVFYI